MSSSSSLPSSFGHLLVGIPTRTETVMMRGQLMGARTVVLMSRRRWKVWTMPTGLALPSRQGIGSLSPFSLGYGTSSADGVEARLEAPEKSLDGPEKSA